MSPNNSGPPGVPSSFLCHAQLLVLRSRKVISRASPCMLRESVGTAKTLRGRRTSREGEHPLLIPTGLVHSEHLRGEIENNLLGWSGEVICVSKAHSQREPAFLLSAFVGLTVHHHSFMPQMFIEHISWAGTELGPGDAQR